MMPGVVGIFDGKQLTGDGIGNIICGWNGIHSQRRFADEYGGLGRLWRQNMCAYVGDAVAVVIAESLAEGPGCS